MSNYRRARVPGGGYFFTVVTRHRQPLFTSEDRIEILRDAFRQIKARRPFDIEAIVILPDHLHALWRLPDGDADFSGRWREIKKQVSNLIAPASDDQGERRVWQRRFWEHLIRDEADWRRHLDYIHYNPVKHGLATRPLDWPWSSFRAAVARGWYTEDWGGDVGPELVGMELE